MCARLCAVKQYIFLISIQLKIIWQNSIYSNRLRSIFHEVQPIVHCLGLLFDLLLKEKLCSDKNYVINVSLTSATIIINQQKVISFLYKQTQVWNNWPLCITGRIDGGGEGTNEAHAILHVPLRWTQGGSHQRVCSLGTDRVTFLLLQRCRYLCFFPISFAFEVPIYIIYNIVFVISDRTEVAWFPLMFRSIYLMIL